MQAVTIVAATLIGAVSLVALAAKSPRAVAFDADAAVKAAFPAAPADWQGRLAQDETLKACSVHRNLPPKPVADAILAREKAAVKYPDDGKLIGDWKIGERLAQSGYGLRFTDYPPA